jgi:recombinational DNA repair ATPase RecF
MGEIRRSQGEMIMPTTTTYQGMRWFKCDLHMHTPADKQHWRGELIADDPKTAAENYIRRCYACGLEMIAITDHNFSSKGFIPHLRKAIDDLSGTYGYKIILFPGFEITADVGRGMHVLALFEPHADLETIDHILTNCGVPMPRKNANGTHISSIKRLPEIIQEVQKKDNNGYLKGIVICPHPNENGIFDNNRISELFQQHEWRNPELFAVEVPKPIKDMNLGWQRLFNNGSDCHAEWKRQRPMAAVISSDAKSFSEPGNAGDYSYIGCRFSWIKMSTPSIESLRQAFLDPESRICLAPEPPQVNHNHIQSIEISGTKFLKDQTVRFSPHLNCLIGGRGSGKSMLFESIRLGLRGETPFRNLSEKDHVVARQVKRLGRTFTDNTVIRLHVCHDGLEDRFVVDSSGAPSRVEIRDVTDAATVFRRLDTLIFSQEEITQLVPENIAEPADRKRSLLDFIDNFSRNRLEIHQNRARKIIDQLRIFRQKDDKIQRLDVELTTLKQETDELARQLAAKTTVQEELKNHRAAQESKRYLEKIVTKAEDTRARLQKIAEELEVEPPPLGSRVENFPNSDYFKETEAKVASAYQDLARNLKASAQTFEAGVAAATSRHRDWPDIQQSIEKAEMDFHAACSEKGLTIAEAEKIRETEQEHRIKLTGYQARLAERDQTAKERPERDKLLEDLTCCWLSETETRQEVLDEIISSTTMPRTETGEAIVKTTLHFSGDREGFLKLWGELSPPRNTRAGRLWDRFSRDGAEENIGDKIFDAFFENCVKQQKTAGSGKVSCVKTTAGNPIQFLEMNWDNDLAWPPTAREYRKEIESVRKEKSEQWFELMLARIQDSADLTLLRSDGSEAGSFQQGDLSTGQKNTAVLSLLLARGTGPVLIDQPEDELDSGFLYKELVPLFRSSKQQRQLIIVTHNANVPVNADAELIYALKAQGGRGVCLSQGGLDRPDVTQAVLDIMEGTEEAFRRRQEKYHF